MNLEVADTRDIKSFIRTTLGGVSLKRFHSSTCVTKYMRIVLSQLP